MEKKTVSLRLPVDMVEYLDRGQGINQGVINAVAQLRQHERYADMEIKGKFTGDEWKFLAASLNGTLTLDDFRFSPAALIAHCEDSETYEGLASQWRVDLKTLAGKIGALTAAQVEALYRRVERYWATLPDIDGWANY